MSSPGGALDDALSLYGFLRTLPIKLTTANMGTIASITIAPFLAGTHRIGFQIGIRQNISEQCCCVTGLQVKGAD
jgi:ATP-dependent protease ClpP protease subunit